MTEKFLMEMDDLKTEVEVMGSYAQEMLNDATRSLKDLDENLAEDVLARKDGLYEMDNLIEEHALEVLTLHQPVAKDMRTLACILKMITYLTRIGRYGYDIAKLTKELSCQKHVKRLIDIPRMAELVGDMVEDVLYSFETGDITRLSTLSDRDDVIDEMRYSIFRECLTYMMEDPRTISRCMHYIMVARYLERCGDHACKIAEKVHHMVTGERVEIK